MGTSDWLVNLADSCTVEGFHFDGGAVDTGSTGDLTYDLHWGIVGGPGVGAVVRQNRLSNIDESIWILYTDQTTATKRVSIIDNEFTNFDEAVYLLIASSDIRDNVFFVNNASSGSPINQTGKSAFITGNRFYRSVKSAGQFIDLEIPSDIVVTNNICISPPDAHAGGIWVNNSSPDYPTTGRIENNLCIGADRGIYSGGGDIRIVNNIIIGTSVDLKYDEVATTVGNVGFNLFWENTDWGTVDTAGRIASGCVFACPMFADTIQYLLQAFSPAIDAGHPSILDVDGSRSDIGPAGGPGGFSYVYQDLPPATPSGFTGIRTDSQIVLTWRANQEADFSAYVLFRTMSPPSHEPPFEIGVDTVYVDTIGLGSRSYSYAIAAKDAQNNYSTYSDILSFAPSSIGDDGSLLPDGFTLHPNYPNPFNASTQITYTLPQPGTVSLTIYDVLGRHVTTLVDDVQAAGEHSVVWHGRDRQGQEVGSGVYFYRLSVGGETEVSKMVVVK
jgi:hypothetical protein